LTVQSLSIVRATFGAKAVDQRFASSMCISPPPQPPLSPVERRVFDYSKIGRSMAQLNLSIRQTQRVLDRLVRYRQLIGLSNVGR
jgi:hypothetical protein